MFVISLNNSSGDVRWSLDLRWQRADQPVGFYGFKEGIMMRSSTQKELKIDWAGFESVDRQTVTGSKLEVKLLFYIIIFSFNNDAFLDPVVS